MKYFMPARKVAEIKEKKFMVQIYFIPEIIHYGVYVISQGMRQWTINLLLYFLYIRKLRLSWLITIGGRKSL